MKEILNGPFSAWIIALLTTLISVLAIPLWKGLKKLEKKAKANHLRKIQEKYVEELSSIDFIIWRNQQLKRIYGEKYFTTVFGHEYPVFYIPFAQHYSYSDFNKVYDKNDIKTEGLKFKNGEVNLSPVKDIEIYKKGSLCDVIRKRILRWKYSKVLKGGIKFELIGFSLDHYDFDEKNRITHIYSKLGTYPYNIYSSHILEYELYRAYLKTKNNPDISLDSLWKYLPFRRYIHYGTGNVDKKEEVLKTGERRYSLFSVQCIVVFKDVNNNGDYSVLLMKRSSDLQKISAKLGYYQFYPAGGFEMYEKETIRSLDMIKENYSLRKAIFREYLEEVFNCTEFKSVDPESNKETTISILNHDEIVYITDMIEKGTATMNLLGVAVDLISLRHEISFVLKIDDVDYSRKDFNPNEEFTRNYSVASKVRIPLKEVESLISNSVPPEEIPRINQPSAMLFKMFLDSEFNPYNGETKKD